MRLLSIDALKGFGIVSFIVWHSYAYYYKYSQASSPVSRGVLFATGLFIALSGFVFGFHYYEKIQRGYPLRSLVFRLMVRCSKLMGYVVVANIAVSALNTDNIYYWDIISKIMSLFYIDRWDVTFQVLFVISIGLVLDLLVLAAFIKYEKYVCYFLTAAMLGLFFIDLFYQGNFPYLWRYIPLSITGAILGILATRWIHQQIPALAIVTSVTVFVGLCVLSIFYKSWYYYVILEIGPYHLLVISLMASFILGGQYVHYLKNTALSIFGQILVILGKYSLFVYFLHVIMIYLSLSLIKERSLIMDTQISSIAMIIAISCVIFAKIVDYLRQYKVINFLYHLFFQ